MLSRKQLYDIMQEKKDCDINEKLKYLEKYLLMQKNYSEEQVKAFKHTFSYIKRQNWKRSGWVRTEKIIYSEKRMKAGFKEPWSYPKQWQRLRRYRDGHKNLWTTLVNEVKEGRRKNLEKQ